MGWSAYPHLVSRGSTILEQRLTQAIKILESFGVRLNPTGRHRSARRRIEKFNQGRSLQLNNDDQRIRLEAADRTALEAILIASAAHRSRRPGTPFTIGKLQSMMKDHSRARDTQFELMLGAMFRLGGVEVISGEPDLRIIYGEERVGVAAKRVESLNPDQLKKRAKEAERQIHRSGLRGWIAFNLDTRFAAVDPTVPEEALVKEVGEIFEEAGRVVKTNTDGNEVIGVMLHGYTTVWEQPAGDDLPRYRTAMFQRRVFYAEDRTTEEYQFAEGFFLALDDRWDRSLQEIWSEDYAWRM